MLLEKPACQGHEIDALAALLSGYRDARVMITDQYRYARALPGLTQLITRLAPGQPIERISVTFSKDRTADIRHGRFVDRSYGVLGYEWLHMLAVLARLLPPQPVAAYLTEDPRQAPPPRERRAASLTALGRSRRRGRPAAGGRRYEKWVFGRGSGVPSRVMSAFSL